MNNLSNNYLLQLLQRFIAKSPLFFRIIQIISAACALITLAPAFLQSVGINVTGIFLTFENKTIGIAAIVAMIIAKLPVENATSSTSLKAQDTGGGGDQSVGGTNPPPGGLPGHP